MASGKIELAMRVERALGYKLPAAYVALMQTQNGGIPRRTCHRTAEPTSWSEDHVALTGIYAIGETMWRRRRASAGPRIGLAEVATELAAHGLCRAAHSSQ